MFQRPRTSPPATTTDSTTTPIAPRPRPVPIDITSSPPAPPTPPPPKRQKITPVRQPKRTPSSSTRKSAGKSSGKNPAKDREKGKNASILSFFKPLVQQTPIAERRNSEKDHHNDELFISHGGYALDVSEPEDENTGEVEVVEWRRKEQMRRELEISSEEKTEQRRVEEVEMTQEEGRVPETQAPGMAKVTPPASEGDTPRLGLGKLKLETASSMLFGSVSKKLFGPPPRDEAEAEPPPTNAPPSSLEFTQEAVAKKEEDESQQSLPSPVYTAPDDDHEFDEEEGDETWREPDGVEEFSEDDKYAEDTQSYEIERAVFDPAVKAIEGFQPEESIRPKQEQRQERRVEDELLDDIEDFTQATQRKELPTCPICSLPLSALSSAAANSHVNRCLDSGGPAPPPKPILKQLATVNAAEPTPSAFTKLMTTSTTSTLWESTARRAAQDHGKPAAQRKCPFYKILFNGPIAVDAFKYGPIPGVAAYFLSHFHSDHYGGLTARWEHGPIFCSRATANLVREKLKVKPEYVHEIEYERWEEVPHVPGLRVYAVDANHCPGSMMFLFESNRPPAMRVLHCGDFRADERHLRHPVLRKMKLDVIYLDTTYLNPKYAFPAQHKVITACASICRNLSTARSLTSQRTLHHPSDETKSTRLLVLVGTYSIGKERIALGIARTLNTKIFCVSTKIATLHLLEDPVLNSFLTTNPTEAQVHLAPLDTITSSALSHYLTLHPTFTHILGFRPSGWSYKPKSPLPKTPRVRDVLYNKEWNPDYEVSEMKPLRGSTEKVAAYAVPYSEHSSFRELSCFCVGVEFGRIVPTVGVGSKDGRARMEGWIEKWKAERIKSGLFKAEDWDGREREEVKEELKAEEV